MSSLWHIARSFRFWRSRLRFCRNREKILPVLSKPHEEISDIAAFSDLIRELHDFCVRDQSSYANGSALSGLVVIEADIHVRNGLKFLGPLFLKCPSAARRGDGLKAIRL